MACKNYLPHLSPVFVAIHLQYQEVELVIEKQEGEGRKRTLERGEEDQRSFGIR